jgi:hypothetical protein
MNTMNRCSRLFAVFPAILLAATLVLPSLTLAQTPSEPPAVRAFPANALRGTLVMTSTHDAKLDGSAARLSPGSRIRGTNGMLVMSGSIIGRELVVNYTRESNGLLHDVWILTDAEIKEKRATASTGRNFIFGSDTDNTPRDDGKTPYHLLPGYSPG